MKYDCLRCRLVLLLLLLLAAGCERRPRIAALPADAVVLAFGDSLTAGTGAPPGQSYPDRLAEQLGRRVISAGVPGEVSAAGLARLPRLLAEHRPQLVILCHGGNDLLRRLDAGDLAANLRAMVELSRQAGADVVLVGVPRPGLFLSTAPLYGDLAEAFGLPLEEDALGTILKDPSLKSDAVHPNARGYAELAAALARLIERAGGG